MKHWQIKIIVITGLSLIFLSVVAEALDRLGLFIVSKEPVTAVEGQIPVISVDFAKEMAPINNQVFGEGVEMPFLDNIWDKHQGFDQNTLNVAKAIKFTNIRFGGATCRSYNWKNGAMKGYRPYEKIYWEGIDQWYQYAKLLDLPAPTICTNIHLPPQDSADWVRYANIEKKYDIINWEMGNEEYLAYANAEDYVRDARAHCSAMKAVDSRIKCGIVGDEKGLSWTNADLLAKLKPGEFDFFISHFYEPEGHFNYYSMYNEGDKYEKNINFNAGRYRFEFEAIGDQSPEIKDALPTLKVCIDKDCSYVDIANSERGKWVKYQTRQYEVKPGTHKVVFYLADDYFNWNSRQDKNIFAANIYAVKEDGSRIKLEFIDNKAWTYSFLASNLATEDKIKEIRNLMKKNKLDMPIYVTEYGWSYGLEAYPNWGLQYDWRSTLFDVLHIQSLIKEAIPQANIWNDLSTGYWKYFSDDAKGKNYWPIFSVFKLMSEKTGDTLVETKLENVPAYNAQKFQTGDRINIPYLSIMSSKKGDRNYINVVNRSQESEIAALIKTNIDYTSVKVSEIAPSSIESHPYRDDEYKENVTIQEKVIQTSGAFNYSFKPFSVTTFEFNISSPVVGAKGDFAVVPVDKEKARLQIETDKAASCRYDVKPNLKYEEMRYELNNSKGGIEHAAVINGVKAGQNAVYYIKCKNQAGFANANDFPVKLDIPVPTDPNVCLVSPNGGNFFKQTAVTISCGKNVTSASFAWDKGKSISFNNSALTVYPGGQKKVLNLKYKAGKYDKIAKAVFDSNQRYCTVTPAGGNFNKDTEIKIECGSQVKRSSWRWNNGQAYSFHPSTEIKFKADFSKTLNISFAYDEMNGKNIQEKTASFSKGFNVPQCVDSDNGKNSKLKASLVYTGKTIKRSYEDQCSNDWLTEYYCDRNNLMAYVKIRCEKGCSNGRCR